MQTFLVVVAFAAFIFFILHSIGSDMERTEAAAKSNSKRKSSNNGRASTTAVRNTPTMATWRIQYLDAQGTSSERTVRIQKVKPTNRQIEAWCEMRHERRTFSLDRIQNAVDMDTGEWIEIEHWLDEYKRSRRKPKAG